ncbi:MAG: peptidylprolyl isomerase [Rikenellaceae bacterium]|nr:peptidylprolyl isomerase [Rikenellaceae bacterium]
MRRISLLVLIALFGLQDNDLSAKTKGPSKSELKAAHKTIAASGSGRTRVRIKTSAGVIDVMLYDQTPLHRDNFIAHA